MKSQHFTELDSIVNSCRTSLKRFACSALTILFWNIGKKLNIYCDKSPSLNKTIIIKRVEKQLKACYGPYFSQAGLTKMMRFAKLFPDMSYVQIISQLISWDELVILLKVKNPEALHFYVNLKIEKGWKKSELQRAILTKLYENEYQEVVITVDKSSKNTRSFSTKKKLNAILSAWDVDTLQMNDLTKPNIFTRVPYRILLNSVKIKFSGLNKDELFKDIFDCIEDYKMSQNLWFNQSLNTLFWEIGKIINSVETNKAVCDDIEKSLKKYRITFDRRQREAMQMFYRCYRNEDPKNLIINIISWEQLLEVLKISDTREQLFYIKLASFEGLNPPKLRKRIKINEYRSTLNNELHIAELLGLQVDKRIKTEKITTKHEIAIFTNVDYTYDLDKIILPKAYENPYFVKFIL